MLTEFDFLVVFFDQALNEAWGPEWPSPPGSGEPGAASTSMQSFLSLPHCSFLSQVFVSLRKQGNEADAFAQRAFGGVRELVQPSDGFSQSEAQPEPRTPYAPNSNGCRSGGPARQLV